MPSLFVRILLFFSSYAPLFVITALQWHSKIGKWSYLLGTIAVVSVVALWLFVRVSRRIAPVPLEIESARSLNAEALNYVATYIFPFLDSRPDDPLYAAGLLVLYAVLGIIYVNSNMIHINPLLNVVGYRLIEVETGGTVCSLITRRRFIARGSIIRVRRLGDDVYMEA
jgi:hypothetical protein